MRARGLSLIELLIVIVVLAILSALAIPRYARSADEARTAVLRSNLQKVRQAMENYAYFHNWEYPAETHGVMEDCAAPNGLGRLVSFTARDHTCASTQSDFHFIDPFLPEIPVNPFTGDASINWLQVQADGTNATAWFYQCDPPFKAYQFLANDRLEHLGW